MTGDRNGLLDELMTKNERLYRAQTLLLDCYAHLDDTLQVAHNPETQSILTAIGHYLEVVPWEKDPAGPDPMLIDTGWAPQVAP